MNRKIGVIAASLNLASVLGFAVCMLAGSLFGSYLSSMMIAFSFVALVCAFAANAPRQAGAAAYCAIAFGAMYALCNLLVYFTQMTTVRQQVLGAEAASLLDYGRFGLLFNLDLLGYCFMAVSTFFAGLALRPYTAADRWLKGLLMVHGVFALPCLILPMLGLFSTGMTGADWVGTAILEFWCLYFAPVGMLSIRYFRRAEQA